MKKLLVPALAAVLTAAALCGCGKSGLKTVNVNEVTHSVFYAPQYAAMELGYFEEEGLQIDLVNGGGSDKSMTAVLSGDADIGLMGPETAVYVYNQGAEDHAVIIGQLTQRDGSFLVSKEPDADFTWDDLRGKTVIGGRVGGMPQMTLEYVMKQNGVLPNVDATVRTDVSFNLMAGAFEASDCEYVTLFEPLASQCEREGIGHIVAAVGDYSGNVPYTAYMVKKSSLEGDRELYEAYMRAVYKGQQWVEAHSPAEIAEVIAPQFPDADVTLLTSVAENYKAIGAWKTEPMMYEEDFERMLTIIDSAGQLDQSPGFDQLFDGSIAETVMAE